MRYKGICLSLELGERGVWESGGRQISNSLSTDGLEIGSTVMWKILATEKEILKTDFTINEIMMRQFSKALIVLLFVWKKSISSEPFAYLNMRCYDSLLTCITHSHIMQNLMAWQIFGQYTISCK